MKTQAVLSAQPAQNPASVCPVHGETGGKRVPGGWDGFESIQYSTFTTRTALANLCCCAGSKTTFGGLPRIFQKKDFCQGMSGTIVSFPPFCCDFRKTDSGTLESGAKRITKGEACQEHLFGRWPEKFVYFVESTQPVLSRTMGVEAT